MFEQCKILPWSGRRYLATPVGDIQMSSGEVVEVKKKNGEAFVELEWVLGRREYSVAVLVLLTYELLKLPDHLMDQVEPLYRDGNPGNLSPYNLLYRFKSGPLEVEGLPGFYYIPLYVDYAISADGELINVNTGKYKSWAFTKPNPEKNQTGGYRYSRVVNDLGFSKTLFQHRALCLVFKDYGADVETMYVNHVDGCPWNNAISNLEWVTPRENNVHAVVTGLRGDNKPVLSRNLQTGEILRFESIGACGRYHGQPRAGFVYHRLLNSPGKVYPDMLQFKFDDGSQWPVIDPNLISRVGRAHDIQARNVFTGDIVIFEGAPSGEALTGVKAGTILTHVRENKVIPVNGWNFRWFAPDTVWPEHTGRHLRVYSKYPIYPPDGVVATDIETDEEHFFESVALACQKFKFTKSVLHNYANSGKTFAGKYTFKLFRLRDELGHPVE